MTRRPPNTEPFDSPLVERMAAGDRDALAALLDEFGSAAWSLARRITRDEQLAEEAVQDAFVELWRHAATFDPRTGSVSAWVLGYVRNKAIDRVRHEQRRRPRTPDGAAAATVDVADVQLIAPVSASDPFASAWIAARSSAVRDALAELSDEHRRILQLAYFDGLSQSEIAAAEQIPLGTVKTRTSRALTRLRDVLSARGEVTP